MVLIVSASGSLTTVLDSIDGETITPNIVCVSNSLQVDIISPKTGSTICISDTLQTNIIQPKNSSNLKIDTFLWPNTDGTPNQYLGTDGMGNLTFFTSTNATVYDSITVDILGSQTGSTICVNASLLVEVVEEKTSGVFIEGVQFNNNNFLASGGTITSTNTVDACVRTLSVATINEKVEDIVITSIGNVFANKAKIASGSVGIFNQGVHSTIVTDASLNNTIMIEGRNYTYQPITTREDIESRHRTFCSVSLQTQITASDGAANDNFGISCDIDGEFSIIGAFSENTSQGAAYIFERHQNGSWSQIQKIIASDGASNDEFGSSVSISGNFAVVSAPLSDSNSGSAYVFEARSDGTWQQVQKLKASDYTTTSSSGLFGTSVSVSGKTLIIGTPDSNLNFTSAGAAYIFERDGNGTWYEKQILRAASPASGDDFGTSVAISGNFAIIGAPLRGTNTGAAYIFEKETSGWATTETQLLTASDSGTNNQFGSVVAIDGVYAVIAAGEFSSNTGKVYVFERNASGTWIEKQIITSPASSGEEFGSSISIKGDKIAIGAQGVSTDRGSVYVYERSITGTWSLVNTITETNGVSNDRFGTSVAIGGNYLVVGADGDDDNGSASGSAFLFEASLAEPIFVVDTIPEFKTGEGIIAEEIFIKDNTLSTDATRLEEECTSTGQYLNLIPKVIYGVSTTNGTIGVGSSDASILTDDVYYANLTVQSGATLSTRGYRVFVNDTLTINGLIENNGLRGGDGGFGTGGIGGISFDGTLGGAIFGGSGSSSSAVNGNNGGASSYAAILAHGGNGGDSDGSGNPGSGGTSVLVSNIGGGADAITIYNPFLQTTDGTSFTGGSGGGGGGASTTPSGGGGGGGGGGIILIAANKIVMPGSGEIQATGGDGGDGGSGGTPGGGGGGGGGGLVVIYTRTEPTLISSNINVSGGTGGTGLNNGSIGSDGRFVIIEA